MYLWLLYLSLNIIEVSHCQSWFDIWSPWQRERSGRKWLFEIIVLLSVSAQARLCIFFCLPDPADPPEKLQLICPTCPLLLPVDSQHAVKAAAITLAHYKRQSTLSAGLGVKRIMRAAAQARLKRHFLTSIKMWEKTPWGSAISFIKNSECTFSAKLWEVCKIHFISSPDFLDIRFFWVKTGNQGQMLCRCEKKKNKTATSKL